MGGRQERRRPWSQARETRVGSYGLGPLLRPRVRLGPEDGGLLTLHHSEPELHADPGALSTDYVSLMVNQTGSPPLSTGAVSRKAGFAGPVGPARGGPDSSLVRGGLGLGHPRSWKCLCCTVGTGPRCRLGLGRVLLLTDPLLLPPSPPCGTQHVFLASCSVAWALHTPAGVTVPSVHRRGSRPICRPHPLPLPSSQVWGLCSGVGTPSCLGCLSSLLALGRGRAAHGCCATGAGGSSLPAGPGVGGWGSWLVRAAA